MRALGLRPLAADLADSDSLRGLPAVHAAVLCQAPSREGDDYETVYGRATENALAALKAKASRLLFVSSTSVYGAADGGWVDESTPPGAGGYPTPQAAFRAAILLGAEAAALRSGIPACVLRLGGLYGPGRHRLEALRRGRLQPVFSDAYTNRMHVDDAAAAAELLIRQGQPGDVYLGVDDEPSRQREFYEWLYALPGTPPRPADPGSEQHPQNKRCSNAKIKALGLRLRYPTFREGYAALLAEAVPR
jgi:nucleoside-diphosphate-sugar epimerase